MIKNFTLNNLFTKACFTFALGFMAFGLGAQVPNTLRVTAPADVAGDYQFAIAAFGQQPTNAFSGTGVFIDDGVEPITDGCETGASNISGRIAFIDRGSCEFGTKALQAQNAGAAAVVICNNDDTPIFQMVPGTDGDNVSALSGMVSRADCETLRVALTTGEIEATILNLCVPPTYGPEVIWGRNTGEGDFNGGLGDWTVENISMSDVNTWHWDANADATGAFTGYQITSPTACNGAVVMSSDSLDNGNTTVLGSGPCPAPCTAELISPTIDVSSADPEQGFFIQFAQAFREFTSTYQVIVSRNGGVTWPDTFQINDDAPVNSPNIDETVRVPLIGYEGTQSIRFKFRYVGNYYYWIIDDVALTNESFVDMQLNDNFYSVYPSWRVPASQVSEMPFLVDMFNNGNVDAENVEIDINIQDENGTEVHAQTYSIGTVDAFTLNENTVAANGTWTPPAVPGIYTGSYAVRAETSTSFPNNLNTTNDTIFFQMEVTENTFQNVPGLPDGNLVRAMTSGCVCGDDQGVDDDVNNATAQGSVFFVPNGEGHYLESVTFGVLDNQVVASGFIHARLYQWFTDSDGGQGMDLAERALVGTNTIIVDTIVDQLSRENITIPLNPVDGAGNEIPGGQLDLANDAQYMLVLLAEPLSPGMQIDLIAANNTNGFDRNFNHGAVNLAFDSLGIDRNPGSYYVGLETGNIADFEAQPTIFSYGINTLWSVMTIQPGSIVNTEDLNSDIELVTYPNPAGEYINVNYTLENPSEMVIEILDFNGRLVQRDEFKAPTANGTVVLDTHDVPSGAYLLNIRTDEGISTEKIMIQK